jgi:hypothetical protein
MPSYDEIHDAIADTMDDYWDTEDGGGNAMGVRGGQWFRWSEIQSLEAISAEQAVEWLVEFRGVDREEAEEVVTQAEASQ